MQSLIAHLPLLNYINPQEDKEVGVNEILIIPIISTISIERISTVKKV
jgi:hypothetical protein